MSNTQKNTFTKKEKLKSKKLTDTLFANGNAFLVFPIRVLYLLVQNTQDIPVQIGVSVSKRHFKKAVDRNRIKRLLREAYRTQKHALQNNATEEKKHLIAFFIYIDKVLPQNSIIEKKMPLILDKLQKALHENITSTNN